MKELKEKLQLAYSYLNRITITGTENAENMTIAAKLLQDIVVNISAEESEKEGDE